MYQKRYHQCLLLSAILVFDSLAMQAQTISNADFEVSTTCPTGQTQITRASGWTRPTGGTPDYFNSCGYNIASTVSPSSGNAYVGCFTELTYSPSGISNYKEYITTHLSAPLTAGVTYTFSFSIAHLYGASPSNMMPSAISYVDLPVSEHGYIGAVFSTATPVSANTENGSANFGATSLVDAFGSGRVLIPATNTAVYGTASRNAWVTVTLQYTATGGEEYMTLGQFRHGISSLPDGEGAYYLFDNFVPALTPLPVSLQSFTATRQGTAALLRWTTAMEQNNKGFELQRSVDGANWMSVEFIPSRATGGNSTMPLSYSYTDVVPLQGTNLYRLRQLDADGHQQYSAVQALYVNEVAVRMYPNPVQSMLYISGLADGTSIKLVNIYGQEIQSMISSGAAVNMDMSVLPAGTYMVYCTDAAGRVTADKIIKE
ncbi:T9SS type A sorting domain-containing protein [Edaphocola aurantiacus]|uniref:T9SS type A sorting domain-containing protein n=1 Tax=Edaphocola aurantiacus TaxID=2601682 RepID=UPI001C97C882|nr:T9SS type A sorting domain-containing protein [Edaphocola aurantiacus]